MSLPEHDVEADRARARLDGATADLDPPFAVLDVDALDANAADLVRRASGTPIRVASKSVRNRAVLRRVLARPGFAGVLAYSLPEALWLSTGEDPVSTDVVVGYPSADRSALRRLAADETAAARVTLMVDSVAQLDLVDAVVPPGQRADLRICLDVDASLRAAGGRVHVGVRRSPVHSVADAVALARLVTERPGFTLVGLMAYEAQIAGVQDAPARRPLRGLAVRGMQKVSARELAGTPGGGRRGRLGGGAAGVRQRGRHGQRRADGGRARRHRGGGGLGAVLPGALRRLPGVRGAAGGLLRRPGHAHPGRPAP